MDRISGLPDVVIRRIVRFLPANSAARVLVLSRRFTNLYTIIPELELEAFLVACHVLKKSIIERKGSETWKGVVSSQFTNFDEPDPHAISFDTPDVYTLVNFDSLVEATLNLSVLVNFSSNPTKLIWKIRHVKMLDLSSPYILETLYLFPEEIPTFENLQHLSFSNDPPDFCWKFLPILLNKTPNLKTLVIKHGLHYVEGSDDGVCNCVSGYSCLLTCHLEVLEITLRDCGTVGELQQVEHFLEKLSCLDFLKVHIWGRISTKENLRIMKDMLMLPRASNKCKIECIIPT